MFNKKIFNFIYVQFSNNNLFLKTSKKAISSVVAIALLLVIAVASVVGFQSFNNSYLSGLFTKVEGQSNGGDMNSGIELLKGSSLYFKNEDSENISILKVKIDNVDCNISKNISYGIAELNISTCINNLSTSTPEVTIYTNNKIYTKTYFVDNSNVGIVSESLSSSSGSFISVWNTSATSFGSSNADQIKLPLEASGTYNFTIDWGDGTVENVTSWDGTGTNHTYALAGVYELNITGVIKGFSFMYSGDRNKFLEIKEYGPLNLGNSGNYFQGCSNFRNISASDTLDLTGTTNLARTFDWANNFNGNINNWDVSVVTDISFMFNFASSFNQPLDNWNVGQVTTLQSTFYGASSFNQPINTWDTKNVLDMGGVFSYATNFNQPLNNWNTSQVTNMNYLFESTSFNQPLNSWDVHNVTSMEGVFNSASNFNYSIDTWNTSQVTNMNFMFQNLNDFNFDLSMWNVSQVFTCVSVYSSTPSWTNPKPIFNLCTP